MFSRFDTILACERHTSIQTDRQTDEDSIYRASRASRGKKRNNVLSQYVQTRENVITEVLTSFCHLSVSFIMTLVVL